METERKCDRGHVLEGQAIVCKACIRDALLIALRQRYEVRQGKGVFSVRAVVDGEVVVQAITNADVMIPAQTGHLLFNSSEGRCIRIYAPGTWLSARDVSAEGPEAVAAFLAEMEGAGTA